MTADDEIACCNQCKQADWDRLLWQTFHGLHDLQHMKETSALSSMGGNGHRARAVHDLAHDLTENSHVENMQWFAAQPQQAQRPHQR